MVAKLKDPANLWQVKSDVLSEMLYCPAEKAVLLASYASQAKYGNYDPEMHSLGYLANDNILPKSVMTEHKLSREEWEEKVAGFHAKHKGLGREETMLEYLKVYFFILESTRNKSTT